MTITMQPQKAEIDGNEYFIELGTIESSMLGREDHGIFTYMLTMQFGGSGQGAGGYALNDPTVFGKHVQALLDTFGGNWEDLKGRDAYAIRAEQFGPILGLVRKDKQKYIIFREVVDGS